MNAVDEELLVVSVGSCDWEFGARYLVAGGFFLGTFGRGALFFAARMLDGWLAS